MSLNFFSSSSDKGKFFGGIKMSVKDSLEYQKALDFWWVEYCTYYIKNPTEKREFLLKEDYVKAVKNADFPEGGVQGGVPTPKPKFVVGIYKQIQKKSWPDDATALGVLNITDRCLVKLGGGYTFVEAKDVCYFINHILGNPVEEDGSYTVKHPRGIFAGFDDE